MFIVTINNDYPRLFSTKDLISQNNMKNHITLFTKSEFSAIKTFLAMFSFNIYQFLISVNIRYTHYLCKWIYLSHVIQFVTAFVDYIIWSKWKKK